MRRARSDVPPPPATGSGDRSVDYLVVPCDHGVVVPPVVQQVTERDVTGCALDDGRRRPAGMLSRWVGTLQDSGRKLQGQLAESGQRLQTTLRESGREIQTKIEEAREQFQVEERARAARVHRAQRLQQMKRMVRHRKRSRSAMTDDPGTENAIVPPWHCEEDGERRGELKRQIFALSADEGLFLKEPSTAIPFDIGVASMFAEVPLAEDRNLSQLRFRLVPRR